MTETHWTLTIADDLKVCVPPDVRLMTPFVLLEQEDWFEAELPFLRTLVQPGMGVLDIGANHGLYALSLAKRLQRQGRVIACEPASAPGGMLERSIAENGLESVLKLLRVGLSDHEGEAQLNIGTNSELNSLNATGATPGQTETVRLTTLDALLASADWPADFRVDVLKLDAEGEEIRILQGGARFFGEQDPLVLFEWKHGNEPNTGLLEAFTALDYDLYRLVPGLQALVPVMADEALDGYQLNLFACKPGRAERLRAAGHLLTGDDFNKPASPPARRWPDVLAVYPYVPAVRSDGQTLAAWQALDRTNDLHWAAYQQALDFYLSAGDAAQPLPARWAWLRMSLAQLDALHRVGDAHLATTLLRIRVLDAAGLRAPAVQVNARLAEALNSDLTVSFDRPFVPPLADYDERPPQGGMGAWLQAAIIEGLEVRRAYSSYFSREVQLLQRIASNPNRSRCVDRRRALLALIDGKQVQVAADSPLRGPTVLGHRNGEWWQRLPQPDNSSSASITPITTSFLLGHFANQLRENPVRIVDVGAASHGRFTEPYASLMQAGCARVLGFEPDAKACEELNRLYEADARYSYLPQFVGDGNPAVFHETTWSMTGSLFRPNTPVLESFEQLGEVVALKAMHPVKTVRLADLPEAADIDMIKIDVQGAELTVFEGAGERLNDVLVIWTEVEFIPLYENQPLFRDIDAFLTNKGFLLHSFDGIASRRFKPFVNAGGRLPRRQQAIWADAIYVRDFRKLASLPSSKLKKLAVLLDQVVGANDLCFEVLQLLDEREGNNLATTYLTGK